MRQVHALMVIYAALISTSFPVVATITPLLDPVTLTLLRFIVAAALFGVWLGARGQLKAIGWSDAARYAAVAATVVTFFVLMFAGLRTASPVSASALFTLAPLMTAFISVPLLGVRTPITQLGLLALGATGAVWVVFDGSLHHLLALQLTRGEITFLIGTVSFACYTPLIKKLHRGEPAMVMAFWTLLFGAIELAIIAAPRLATQELTIDPRVWAGILYLAAVPTAVTFAIAQFASVRLPSHQVMAYTYLTPVFVVLLALLRGQGTPSKSTAVGFVMLIAATLLLQLRGKK